MSRFVLLAETLSTVPHALPPQCSRLVFKLYRLGGDPLVSWGTNLQWANVHIQLYGTDAVCRRPAYGITVKLDRLASTATIRDSNLKSYCADHKPLLA